jgi:CDP-diacylglycerol--glycerol-3-phosphate 3-phosphatidyltransferase
MPACPGGFTIHERKLIGMQKVTQKSRTKTFTDYMRVWFKDILDPIGAFFNRIGVTPNMMTMLGLVGNMIGAWFLSQGNMFMGGVFVLICTPFDALDGTMARLRGEANEFGAFVDSVTDRYSELFILGGLLYHFTTNNDHVSTIVVYAAAAGSVLVSYVKARADSLKFDANVGILTRMERYLVIAPLLLIGQPVIAVWIVAVLANITALQRFWKVRQQSRKQA